MLKSKSFARVSGCIATAALITLISGCATPNATKPEAGTLRVVYSTQIPGGGTLKTAPSEITVVRREDTSKAAAAQVGLALLMLVGAGGAGFNGFDKGDLMGASLQAPGSRANPNLANPFATEFVTELGRKVGEEVRANPAWKTQTFAQPIYVSDGRSRLVYETLVGTDEQTFRLKTDLVVHKRKEAAGLLTLAAPGANVSCSTQSTKAQPLAWWAEDNYRRVGEEVRAVQGVCAEKVMKGLEAMLKG